MTLFLSPRVVALFTTHLKDTYLAAYEIGLIPQGMDNHAMHRGKRPQLRLNNNKGMHT